MCLSYFGLSYDISTYCVQHYLRKIWKLCVWLVTVPKKRLPNLTSLFLSVPSNTTKEVLSSKVFGLHWLKLKRFHLDYPLADLDIHTSLCEAIKEEKLKHLTYLAIQVRSADPENIMKLSFLEKISDLKTLCLHGCFFHEKCEMPKTTLLGLSELNLYCCEELTEVLPSLLCQSLQLQL